VQRISGKKPQLILVIYKSISIGITMLGFPMSSPMPPPTISKMLGQSLITILIRHRVDLFLNGRSIKKMKMKLLLRPRVPISTSSKVWIDLLMIGQEPNILCILMEKITILQNSLPNVNKRVI